MSRNKTVRSHGDCPICHTVEFLWKIIITIIKKTKNGGKGLWTSLGVMERSFSYCGVIQHRHFSKNKIRNALPSSKGTIYPVNFIFNQYITNLYEFHQALNKWFVTEQSLFDLHNNHPMILLKTLQSQAKALVDNSPCH